MKFFTRDIPKITGVKVNRLQGWIERGFVSPSIKLAEGHGTKNIWSIEDLYTIAVFKQITESGFSRKNSGEFLAKGVLTPEVCRNEAYLILFIRRGNEVESSVIYYDEEGNTDLDLKWIMERSDMNGFDDIYIINFAKIRNEIDEKAAKVIKDFWKKRV